MSDGPFSPEVVDAILVHMNREHGDDSLVICRAYGPAPDAVAAELVALDDAGLHFDIDTGSGHAALTLAWTEPVEERGDIRADIVRRYHAARDVLGLGPADPH